MSFSTLLRHDGGDLIKLKTFDFIDQVNEYKNENIDIFKKACGQIVDFFTKLIEDDEDTIHITSRLKTDESLTEKIIRQNYANKFSNAEAFFAYLTDLIGIRIECRFIEDEEKIYQQLVKKFSIEKKNGYFTCKENENILLKLSEKQPGRQKNGFEIYKIDGLVKNMPIVVNFELQIKSMVNLFWGEIDHKILYKNFNYLLTEDFIRQIMYSIKEGLIMIDNQMQIVFNRLSSMDNTSLNDSRDQIKSVVSKTIHDAYTSRLKEDLHLIVDFRNGANLITDYIFAKVQYLSRESFAAEFIRVLDEILISTRKGLKFGEAIEFGEVKFLSQETKKLGSTLIEVANEKFLWNIILIVIFDLNKDNEKEREVKTFTDYLYFVLVKALRDEVEKLETNEEDKKYILDTIVDFTIEYYLADLKESYFVEKNLKKLSRIARRMCKRIEKGRDLEIALKEFNDELRGFDREIENEDID